MSGIDRDDLFPSRLQKIIRGCAVVAGIVLGSAGALALPELIGEEALPKALSTLKALSTQPAALQPAVQKPNEIGVDSLPKVIESLKSLTVRIAEQIPALNSDRTEPAPVAAPVAPQSASPTTPATTPQSEIVSAEPAISPESEVTSAEPVTPHMPAPTMPAVPAMPAVAPPVEVDVTASAATANDDVAPVATATNSLVSDQFVTASVAPPGEALVSSIEILSPTLSVVGPKSNTAFAAAPIEPAVVEDRQIKPIAPKPDPAIAAAVAMDELVKQNAIPQLVDVPLPLARPDDIPGPSPADRLALFGKERAKAERCLAQAVYFEARDQAVRGQVAVAQVVINRVFSPYYPGDVCSVVYQNAHRRLACQFTFACDGHPEVVRERGAWARAQRIARNMLDGKTWLPEVAKSTHYHASYVRPRWVREMRTMVRYGVHTFYRPRRWGDGSNEPSWGVASVKKTKG